jgi:hypothetical protein
VIGPAAFARAKSSRQIGEGIDELRDSSRKYPAKPDVAATGLLEPALTLFRLQDSSVQSVTFLLQEPGFFDRFCHFPRVSGRCDRLSCIFEYPFTAFC